MTFGHFSELITCDQPLVELLQDQVGKYGWPTNKVHMEVKRHRNGYYLTPSTGVAPALAHIIQDGRRFPVLLADLPWQFGDTGPRGGTGPHYQALPEDEVCAMPINEVVTENATLFLWCPDAMLEAAGRVMTAWGFRRCGTIIWDKEDFGCGSRARLCHEYLLIGIRGRPPTWNGDIPSVIQAPRGRHSEKPAIFHRLIEKALGGLDRLELFARKKRKGWWCVGDQLEPAAEDDYADEVYPSCGNLKRVHCALSTETFMTKPIRDLLTRWIGSDHLMVDPFACNAKRVTTTYDISDGAVAQCHTDVLNFLALMKRDGRKFDRGLFYPMHTSRQLAECFEENGHNLAQAGTQSFWHKARDDLNEVIKPGGIVISFGWSSVGMGKRRGYQLIDGLLMCHGSDRPDTIAVVEQKLG